MYRWLTRRAHRERVTILCFHRLPLAAERLDPEEYSFEDFRELIDDLAQTFRFLPLLEATDKLRLGCLDEPTMVLTFDDGYPSWTRYVLDYLREKGIRATFFLTTGQLRGEPLWNVRIETAVHGVPDDTPSIDGLLASDDSIDVSNRLARVAAVRVITREIKYATIERREEVMCRLEAVSDAGIARSMCLGPEALLELHHAGMELGAHSVRHPILARCGAEDAEKEITQSRRDIEAIVGPVRMAFAYPNGIPGVDYSPGHVEFVRKAGFDVAVSTAVGVCCPYSPMHELPRFTPWARSRLMRHLSIGRNARRRVAASTTAHPTLAGSMLMVAFHFPPQAGSSGVLRSTFFARHLDANGWRVHVLSASAGSYERTSNELLPAVPNTVRVTRARAFDARRSFSVRGRYPDLLAIPDRWSSWCIDGIRRCVAIARADEVDVIWSTYPILSAHVIAGVAARWLNRPWIAEFRDPVLHEDERISRTRRRVMEFLEGWVLNNADHCVVTTHAARTLYANRYPRAAARIEVIENGYDESVFDDLEPRRLKVTDDRMLVLHSGAIYPSERDPSILFSVLSSLVTLGVVDPARLCVRFRAPGDLDAIERLARMHGVEEVVDVAPPIPYREAIAEMLGADALLVFQGTAFNRQIPAKVYEYLRTRRPIVALVDNSGETAARVSMFDGVRCVEHVDREAISRAVMEEWQAFIANTVGYRAPARSLETVISLSRQSGAGQLARILEGRVRGG